MIEKISKVNDVLEQLVLKLKNNYERLEKRAIQAERDIDDDATTSEYEALALLKKDAIMNKILYQYYSQRLRPVMDRAENSVVEMAAISGDSDSFELEMKSRDFTKINLDELCKGVRSNAVTEEILSSFEMFSGNDAAPKDTPKIKYESAKGNKYDIEATDDEFILSRVGSDCAPVNEVMLAGGDAQPMSEELMHAGGSSKPLSYEQMTAGGSAIPEEERLRNVGGDARSLTEEDLHAGGSAEPLTAELVQAGGNAIPEEEKLKYIGGDARPITDELRFAGGDAEPLEEKLKYAGGDAEPVDEKMMYIGGDAEPVSPELMCAGGDAMTITEEMKHAGGSAEPITAELLCAGGDAIPEGEKLKYAGGDAEPISDKKPAKKSTKKVEEKADRKTKFSSLKDSVNQ